MTERGRIIVGLCGYYDVMLDDGRIVRTVARGKFRREGIKPLAGDIAGVVKNDEKQGVYGAIDEILPRSNFFVRPPVANIDRVLVLVSADVPRADLMLLDRLLIQAVKASVEPVVCVSKCDTARDDFADMIVREYSAFRVIKTSSQEGYGLDEIRSLMTGAITAVAGQSGVGKSSLLNAVFPGIALEVGDLSRKVERGRHTTRASVLIPLSGGGFAIDTPGFSLIESELTEPSMLKELYPELKDVTGCRFGTDCLHSGEPGCAVVLLDLPKGRMERYRQLLTECRERWKDRYRSGG